ncbi:glutamine synthetase [Oxobacter pfennigii]|uniref:Glutamine synthetase n=1 Tax=Oxobacter pfennigii TaxID=36849 RepID=A0A0P9ACX3_9CLOT|nr:type I glutamate--ammonia ligase [Oxobacter pfennigii]KPU42940.1 glutamine synthetase [Oxobacter pfennigii]
MAAKLSKEDVLRSAHDSGVEFIHLQITDILGIMKNVSITIEELEKALNGEIIFDGSSIEGFVRVEESDMYLKPDPSTFVIYPWRTSSGYDARLICDVYTLDGEPYEGDPRYALKRVLKEAKDLGYDVKMGPECEFFLFHTDERGRPTTITHDNAGYYDLAPVDLGEAARREMVVALKEMGYEVDTSHHEIAPGQHEIDLKVDDALSAADKLMTFKAVVRTIAQRHGLHATFMPKPSFGLAGSGLHFNLSLFKNDENAFYDTKDKIHLSKEAYFFMGGLLKHSKALTAITNPTVNSYKRLISGYDSPLYITWSSKNSSSLLKIPPKRGKSTRVELRSPDPSCNPYLALAVILKSGLDGIKNSTLPPPSIDKNVYEMDVLDRIENNVASLPQTLDEALKYLREDDILRLALGEYIYSRFMEAKMIEWQEYSKRISPWEIEEYLTKF